MVFSSGRSTTKKKLDRLTVDTSTSQVATRQPTQHERLSVLMNLHRISTSSVNMIEFKASQDSCEFKRLSNQQPSRNGNLNSFFFDSQIEFAPQYTSSMIHEQIDENKTKRRTHKLDDWSPTYRSYDTPGTRGKRSYYTHQDTVCAENGKRKLTSWAQLRQRRLDASCSTDFCSLLSMSYAKSY